MRSIFLQEFFAYPTILMIKSVDKKEKRDLLKQVFKYGIYWNITSYLGGTDAMQFPVDWGAGIVGVGWTVQSDFEVWRIHDDPSRIELTSL